MTSLVENAALIAKYMLDNGHFIQKWVSPAGLIESLKMSAEEFSTADSYLLEKGYIKGTGGGAEGGNRWLTAPGVDFAESNAPQKKKRGLPLDVAIAAQRIYDPNFGSTPTPKGERNIMPDPRKVFVVHGRNERIRKAFFDLLRALGLDPIEWSEAVAATGKASPYVGEILDAAFKNAKAVVVLITPDDEVRLSEKLWSPQEKDEEKKIHRQARPNVLFEAGMAMGRDPDHTLLVEVGNVKAFSDVGGRHTLRLSNDVKKRQELANRLETAGCAVSRLKTDWLSTGSFNIEFTQSDTFAPAVVPDSTSGEKIVDMEYPKDSGLKARLADEGYEVRWCMEDKLSRKIDIEGWALVTLNENGRQLSLKLLDGPYNQILIKKKVN
jgi:predicted nucleotide-binding protein